MKQKQYQNNTNENIITAMRSWPGLPLVRLWRHCQRNWRRLLTTSSDGRTRLSTSVVWRQSRTGSRINMWTYFSFEIRIFPTGRLGEQQNRRCQCL